MNSLTNFLLTSNRQKNLDDIGKLALRILFGASLIFNHGWPTFYSALSGSSEFPDPLGLGSEISILLAGSAEFIFVLFVIFGLFTRISLIPILINFTVAFFIFHHGDPFGQKEMAYIYLSAMSILMLFGPGKYSLDHHLFNKTTYFTTGL